MAEDDKPGRRFGGPSDSIDLRRLERETKKLLFLGILVAILINAAAGALYMFFRTEVRIVRPPMVQFITIKPRLTRVMKIEKRHFRSRVLMRKIPSRSDSIDIVQPLPRWLRIPDFPLIQHEYSFDIEVASVETPPLFGDFIETKTPREPEKHISMREELLSLNDLDTGQYKAMVVQNPASKQDIKGFVYIPTVWGAELKPPDNLKRSFLNLVEAVNRYTDITAKSDPHLYLDSRKLLSMPFILITTDSAFELTGIERKNLEAYLRNGGFAFVDNGTPQLEYGQAEASLRQMLKNTLGTDARFLPIPVDHPLYHCFFDFDDGPPNGSELQMVSSSSTGMQGVAAISAYMSKQVYYLEGIWLGNRLVAIYSDKGYVGKWKDYSNNEPQLKMGVNIVVYALTQHGGIARQKMDSFTEINNENELYGNRRTFRTASDGGAGASRGFLQGRRK